MHIVKDQDKVRHEVMALESERSKLADKTKNFEAQRYELMSCEQRY